LGPELVSLEEKFSFLPKKHPMVEEKRDNGAGYSINLLLEESLQRNTMMDNFS
jgi:hypothetical protein